MPEEVLGIFIRYIHSEAREVPLFCSGASPTVKPPNDDRVYARREREKHQRIAVFPPSGQDAMDMMGGLEDGTLRR
jgi:hypothetical protein